MVRKILIYGDLDLNIIDGSSIWLVNLAKLLLEDKENYVDILLKKRIRNHILVGEIEKRYRIKLLYVKDYIDNITEVDAGNIVKVLKTVDELRDYSCMIIRGTQVMERVASSDVITKVIPYLTDFCHDKDKMPDTQKSFLKDLYRKVQAYFVQTQAMKEYLQDVLKVDGEKFHVLYPVVFPGKKQQQEPKTLVYAGKIAKNWNILELLDIMEKLKEGYEAVNPNASIEIQQSDSTTGVEQAISGVCDIGMASRELKDSETSEGITGTQIAIDGIAVIVNNENSMTDITSDQVKQIYTGEVTNWEDLQ